MSERKFNSNSTAEKVAEGIDLGGKFAIVTGASSGIGAETARVLAARGACVVLGCRNDTTCSKVAEDIRTRCPGAQVECQQLDLASLSSVRAFAAEYKAKKRPLNILVNNAGVMLTPLSYTEDGNEIQLATNHFGHFLLTNLLLDTLKSSAPARVVVVSSGAMRSARGTFDDWNWKERAYSSWGAYGQSKLANALFSTELNRRLEGTGVTSNALHPGVIATNLTRDSVLARVGFNVGRWLCLPGFKSVGSGAATSVYVATAPELNGKGGLFFSDCQEKTPAHSAALDAKLAGELWKLSEEVTGLAGAVPKTAQ